MLGFKSSRKTGRYFEIAVEVARKCSTLDFNLKGKRERDFEFSLISHLKTSKTIRDNITDQISKDNVDKIKAVEFFGYKHRPDACIGVDGTAIELKVMQNSQTIREILGQAICYRMHYRFVVLVIVNKNNDIELVKRLKNKNDSENLMLRSLAEDLNIFTVFGPSDGKRNLVFVG